MTDRSKSRNITPGKGDIYTWLDCHSARMMGYRIEPDIMGCYYYQKGVVSSCYARIDCGLCFKGYAR